MEYIMELISLCKRIKKVRSSQPAILALNWIRHSFSLWVSLMRVQLLQSFKKKKSFNEEIDELEDTLKQISRGSMEWCGWLPKLESRLVKAHPRDANEFHKEEEVLWSDIYKNQTDEEFKDRLCMNSHFFYSECSF